jgi:putative spermidine/putrescine transport system permease protein
MSSAPSFSSASTPKLRENVATALLLLPALIFLGGWFWVPLARLFSLSLSSEAGPFAAYAELLSSTVFRQVFLNTLMLAGIVTAICVVLA